MKSIVKQFAEQNLKSNYFVDVNIRFSGGLNSVQDIPYILVSHLLSYGLSYQVFILLPGIIH